MALDVIRRDGEAYKTDPDTKKERISKPAQAAITRLVAVCPDVIGVTPHEASQQAEQWLWDQELNAAA
ncbi:MAG: hypothetical protein WDZ79_02120 [Candidatus Paceibacterota bacterium]